MEKQLLEEKIKEIIDKVLTEETSKVKREEYNRVQFKIDDLCNSIGESIKELRKLERTLPNGLKSICMGRINSIEKNLHDNEKLITQLKDKVKTHKKKSYSKKE